MVCTRRTLSINDPIQKSQLLKITQLFQESGVHGVDSEGLQRVLQPVSSLVQKWFGQQAAEIKNREKSPQSKFFDKIQNSVDKIDKKMKQIQVNFYKGI